jgi:hypothetical protein
METHSPAVHSIPADRISCYQESCQRWILNHVSAENRHKIAGWLAVKINADIELRQLVDTAFADH